MHPIRAIIFLDGYEILLRIYEQTPIGWQCIEKKTFDLTPFSQKHPVTAATIIEIMVGWFTAAWAQSVGEWTLIGRNMLDNTIQEVAHAIHIPGKLLDLTEEQELLCKGVLLYG